MSEPDFDNGSAVHASERIEDQWVDQVVPEGFDWKAVVRQHPLVSMVVVAAGGFVVGRWQSSSWPALWHTA